MYYHCTTDRVLIVAEYSKQNKVWTGHCINIKNGDSELIRWTAEQMTAILILVTSGTGKDYNSPSIHGLAWSAVNGWNPDCRPF